MLVDSSEEQQQQQEGEGGGGVQMEVDGGVSDHTPLSGPPGSDDNPLFPQWYACFYCLVAHFCWRVSYFECHHLCSHCPDCFSAYLLRQRPKPSSASLVLNTPSQFATLSALSPHAHSPLSLAPALVQNVWGAGTEGAGPPHGGETPSETVVTRTDGAEDDIEVFCKQEATSECGYLYDCTFVRPLVCVIAFNAGFFITV